MVRPLLVANFPDVVGGGELGLIDLVVGLEQRGFEPVVAVPARAGRTPTLFQEYKRRVVIPWSIVGSARSISKICRNVRPEIGVIHVGGARGLLAATLARAGKRIIWHARVAANDKIDFLLKRLPDTIIANSRATAARFPDQSNVHVVYNGVPAPRTYPSALLPPRSGEKRIAVIGRMTPEKGHLDLMPIIPGILEGIPRIVIYFIGDNRTKIGERLRTISRQSGGRVVMMGPVAGIADHMTEFDLILIPSRVEGFGRVAVEALRSGVTPLAARVGGLVEVLADLDRLFLPGSHCEWTEKLREILENPPYSRGILKMCGDQYDIKRHLDEIIRIYNDPDAPPRA